MAEAIIKSLRTDDNGIEKYVYPRTVADAIFVDSSGTTLSVKLDALQTAIDNITGFHVSDFAKVTDLNNYFKSTGGKLTGGVEMVSNIPYIDMHYGSDETVDYTTRIFEDRRGVLGIRNGDDVGKMLRIDTSTLTGTNDVLHTGNSAQCVLINADPGIGATVNYANGTLLFVKKTT